MACLILEDTAQEIKMADGPAVGHLLAKALEEIVGLDIGYLRNGKRRHLGNFSDKRESQRALSATLASFTLINLAV